MGQLEKHKIKYMKSELENYFFLIRLAASKSVQMEYLKEQGSEEEPIKQLNHETEMILARIDNVDDFMNRLEAEDQIIIYHLHMTPDTRKRYEYYCFELGMAKMTLHRYVKRVILEHWET